jgi:hypothetical protein
LAPATAVSIAPAATAVSMATTATAASVGLIPMRGWSRGVGEIGSRLLQVVLIPELCNNVSKLNSTRDQHKSKDK